MAEASCACFAESRAPGLNHLYCQLLTRTGLRCVYNTIVLNDDTLLELHEFAVQHLKHTININTTS